MKTIKRSVECKGYDWPDGGHVDCGNIIYEPTWSDDNKPVWKCTNCRTETPRQSRHRRSNHELALEAWKSIKSDWAVTDEELDELVNLGLAKSGTLLVYCSTFNYHLDKLLLTEHPTNWDLKYHTAGAREDLAKAKAYVLEVRCLTATPQR